MVVLILVDALSGKYITEDNMPFLYNWAQENNYVKRIHASCGYCERTEVFTGMYPSTSNNFTAIGHYEGNNIYSNSFVLRSMSLLEKISSKNTRRLFNIYSKMTNKKMLGYQIPFQILNKFNLTEDRIPHDNNDAFIGESIFSILNKKNKSYTLDLFTALDSRNSLSDVDRVIRAKNCMDQGYDFLPIYIGMIDTKGHKYVDDPERMKTSLLEVDTMIQSLIGVADAIPNTSVMVLGDHGMEKVDEILDVECVLKHIPLKKYRDYDYFLDSTIVRFWCHNENKRTIIDAFDEFLADKGFWIDDELAAEFHIPYGKDRVYGDMIWCAKTGKLIYPDFFNKAIDHGMHGYAMPTGAGKGVCIFSGCTRVIEEGRLIDVCPTLCKLLNIHIPDLCEGKSFI